MIRINATLVAMTLALACTLRPALAEEQISQEAVNNYYEEVAMGGEPYAQLSVGEILYSGDTGNKDLVRAYAWFAVAHHQGVMEAENFMNKIRKELDAEKMKSAEALGKEFIANYSLPQ